MTLHPITIGTTQDPGHPATPGDLVTYHGRIRHERGNLFYVSAVDADGLLTLIDRDYPSVAVLRQVSRSSARPTGASINLCDCGHEAGNPGRGSSLGWCEARPCECRDHHDVRAY